MLFYFPCGKYMSNQHTWAALFDLLTRDNQNAIWLSKFYSLGCL